MPGINSLQALYFELKSFDSLGQILAAQDHNNPVFLNHFFKIKLIVFWIFFYILFLD